MELPLNTKLPFFAYGIFKKNAISYPNLEPLVHTVISDKYINLQLMVRDGIPILNNDESGRALGDLIYFKDKIDNKDRTLYSLRHTYATQALTFNRMSVHTLAKHMSTSVKMIESHYGHVLLRRKAHEIAGRLTENNRIKY